MKIENKQPPTKEKISPENLLALLKLAEYIETKCANNKVEKNQDGMMDNNGRWIKY